jgi:hypothetical protein
MRFFRRLYKRLTSWARTHQDEARLQAEIAEHIALQTADNLRAGMPPAEARRQAMLRFGAVEAMKEEYRDQRSLPFALAPAVERASARFWARIASLRHDVARYTDPRDEWNRSTFASSPRSPVASYSCFPASLCPSDDRSLPACERLLRRPAGDLRYRHGQRHR